MFDENRVNQSNKQKIETSLLNSIINIDDSKPVPFIRRNSFHIFY